MADSDDPVGYKKPPRASRFKPGRSGNPKGRPRGSKNLSTIIQQELNTPVIVNENGRRRKISKRQAIAKQLVNNAAAGDPKAIPILLSETRLHEAQIIAGATHGVFGGADDQRVMASILRRIRQADAAPPSAAAPDGAAENPAPFKPEEQGH
jgi:hypothetical protein